MVAAMFIERVPNRTSPPAILIRESFREGTKVHKRTLANISKLPEPMVAAIGQLIKGAEIAAPVTDSFEIRRTLPHGHAAAVLGTMRKTGLDALIKARTKDEHRSAAIVRALIVNRVIAPGSKLAFWRALEPATATSSLAKACDLENVAEREVYAALDWLLDQQSRIETALAKKHLRSKCLSDFDKQNQKGGALVLYDVSSSYLEARCCELARHGYSRDHRRDRPQIVYGLLCAADGCPVAIEVFEGNSQNACLVLTSKTRGDPKTLTAQVKTLKNRFKLANIVLVGDRGMITSARITEDLKPAGLDWISCLKAPQIRDLVAAGPLQLSLFDERDLAEISAPELFPGERLIACRNPLLAGERARKRSALLEATERNLKRVAEAVRRAPKKHTAAVVGLKIGAVIDKHKMAKHFVLDIRDGHVAFRRDDEKIAAEATLDGIYVIRTSVPKDQFSAEDAVGAYKSLAQVERAFCTMKGVDLQIRPIHHWLGDRVRAHVFLCMLAYYVEFHMRRALAPMLFAEHAPEARERKSIVAPAEPSPATIDKRTQRRSADGQPVLAWPDLLAHLATLTLNEVALPMQGTATFTLLARPTALQEKTFALLDLPPLRVQ
jgi:transposase